MSLTERLTLKILATKGELPAGRVFAELMQHEEPLPYLGDLMFHVLLRPLINAPNPLLHEGQDDVWARRPLRLTALGERILAQQVHWLDQSSAERWVGGVRIVANQKPWVVSGEGQVCRRP